MMCDATTAAASDAKAVRLHASTLLLVDWQDGDTTTRPRC